MRGVLHTESASMRELHVVATGGQFPIPVSLQNLEAPRGSYA